MAKRKPPVAARQRGAVSHGKTGGSVSGGFAVDGPGRRIPVAVVGCAVGLAVGQVHLDADDLEEPQVPVQ